MTTIKPKLSSYDILSDIEKIKNAFLDTTYDVKGIAGEILSDSVEGMKEHSENIKQYVLEYTSEKPFKSLGIALLVGIAIGYFSHKD